MSIIRLWFSTLEKRPWTHFLFYICGFGALLLSHKIAPTSLAGPGLELFAIFVFAISIVVLAVRTLIQKGITPSTRWRIILVHVAGIIALFWWMNQPS